MENHVFRKSTVDRIDSPEQINEYIKVSSPSVWIILAAVLILLAAVFIWSVTGSLPTQISTAGIAKNGLVTCYLTRENAAKLREGMPARLTGGESGTVVSVGTVPLSAQEVDAAVAGDYALHALNLSDWNVPVCVSLDTDLKDGQVYTLVIVTDSVNPIEFLLSGQGD